MMHVCPVKRDDRKKVKASADQAHPDPHDGLAEHNECHVSGSVNVRGEVETKRPPDLTKEHNTERKEDKTSNRNKFVVEVTTLIVVGIYAGLTGWQGCSNKTAADAAKKSADVAKDTFEKGRRSWVGVIPDTPTVLSLQYAHDGNISAIVPYVKLTLKNYGISPALRTDIMAISGLIDTSNLQPFFHQIMLEDVLTCGGVTAALLEKGDDKTIPIGGYGIVIFPQESESFRSYPKNESGTEARFLMMQGAAYSDASQLRTMHLKVVGCIGYGDEFTTTQPHLTQFCYQTPKVVADVKPADVMQPCPLSQSAQ